MVLCKAHKTRTGEPCKRHAIRGANPDHPVCAAHGGSAPQVKSAAERRWALAKLINEGAMTGEDRRHPWEILLDALARLDAACQHSGWPGNVELVQQTARLAREMIQTRSFENYIAKDGSGPLQLDVLIKEVLTVVVSAIDWLDLPPDTRAQVLDWLAATFDALANGADRPELPPAPAPAPAPAPEYPRAPERPATTRPGPGRHYGGEVLDVEVVEDEDDPAEIARLEAEIERLHGLGIK